MLKSWHELTGEMKDLEKVIQVALLAVKWILEDNLD
jgi:hypothetical protein